ncbi:hypothetical protein GWK47_029906 [Chionoecetes opilio]|uniref:Uncharacterized protein n=1 Tax=Chionoecetes opilio TaxID=41210 RepID=A0A8J5D2U0_CHIOP|nr:hypothetical protein GWK47_029906 [Chionoecetes opilio]
MEVRAGGRQSEEGSPQKTPLAFVGASSFVAHPPCLLVQALYCAASEAPSPAVSVGPYFLSPGGRNITATVGQTAYLLCRVAQLTDTQTRALCNMHRGLGEITSSLQQCVTPQPGSGSLTRVSVPVAIQALHSL